LIGNTSLIADVRATPPLTRGDLQRVNVPVLALYGEHSDLRERSELLLAGLKNFDIRIIENCTHAILWEATSRLREEMALFLIAPTEVTS
jgi:pimeloyl-ACP methyl ester carboxylesterase